MISNIAQCFRLVLYTWLLTEPTVIVQYNSPYTGDCFLRDLTMMFKLFRRSCFRSPMHRAPRELTLQKFNYSYWSSSKAASPLSLASDQNVQKWMFCCLFYVFFWGCFLFVCLFTLLLMQKMLSLNFEHNIIVHKINIETS